MSESRAYTQEECQDLFLEHIRESVKYWSEITGVKTIEERLSGLAFSILNIIDGSTFTFPALDIVLRPHEEDKEYNKGEGDNWFEPGMVVNDTVLHELYYKKQRR